MSFFNNNKEKQFKFTTNNEVRFLSTSLEDNTNYICEAFNYTNDLKMRNITFREKVGKIIYLETMADPKLIEQSFLNPLREANKNKQLTEIITNIDLNITSNFNEIISGLLQGSCAFIITGDKEAFLFNTPQQHDRSPEEPENEKIVRGSHQGFVESLDININLLRKRIVNSQLTIEYYKLGNETNKNAALVYMSQLANPSLIEDIENRISSITADMVLAPGDLEEYLEDSTFSPFPQIMYTERPDRLEAQLMEGRAAIICEGSSDVIVMPVTFFSFFQTSDDYNVRFYTGSVFRLLRLFSFWGTLLFPPLYIAVVGFHFEIIPFKMVTLVKESIETIPYPPFFEAMLMAITIELIREAGIRLPTSIGQTIGIVGGLIIGEAIVNAGLVSNIMVIIIALTAIMSFSFPSYEMGNTTRLLNFPIMIAAATFGFVGIVMLFMFIIVHMCKLESFRTPYIAPFAPLNLKEFKDAIVRFPVWSMKKRPTELHAQQKIKQGTSREWNKDD